MEHQQKTDDKQNILVGAKKRKAYKSQSRPTTPTDSGFKESSEESLQFSNCSPTDEVEETSKCTENLANRKRSSTRLKIMKEEHDKLSPAQQNLKKSLERCRTFRSNKRIDSDELKRWSPRVMIRSISQGEILRLTDDWSFLNHLKPAFPLREVAQRRTGLDGKKSWLVDGVWGDHHATSETFSWERRSSSSQ